MRVWMRVWMKESVSSDLVMIPSLIPGEGGDGHSRDVTCFSVHKG